MHGHEPKGVDCPAIDGIIKEADEVAGDVADKEVLDAALLASAQAVEHYEITRYGTLVAWAKQLGRQDCATVLQQILDQEKATDQKLNRIAESKVNAGGLIELRPQRREAPFSGTGCGRELHPRPGISVRPGQARG